MVMNVELQATCSALGCQEKGKGYVREPDCLETVKDLIRFLKREDDTFDVRRELGHAQILQNDLLPILHTYHKERNLFEAVVRLLVNLTQPAILCFRNVIPEDKTMRNYYLEIESDLQSYKDAFVDDQLFSVLTEKLGDLLKLDWEHRHEEDRLLIERLLILIRNVLHVPPNMAKEQRTDDDASTHDQLLWTMNNSGMEDLLLYGASSDEERQLSLHVLEIVSLMFRDRLSPEMLACAGVQRSMTEKENDERELELIREQELAKKRAALQKFSTRRERRTPHHSGAWTPPPRVPADIALVPALTPLWPRHLYMAAVHQLTPRATRFGCNRIHRAPCRPQTLCGGSQSALPRHNPTVVGPSCLKLQSDTHKRWRPSRRHTPRAQNGAVFLSVPSFTHGPRGALRVGYILHYPFEIRTSVLPSTLSEVCRVEAAPLRWPVAVSARPNAQCKKTCEESRRKCPGGASRGRPLGARAHRVPHSDEPACPTEKLESRVREGARSSHPFGAGRIAAQLRPPGQACSPAKRYP
ncbi:hypothetical protein ScPMuIL_006552 [Solemya velum]